MTSTSRRSRCPAVCLSVWVGLVLAAAGCITPDGYYRDLDAGASGTGGAGSGSGGVTGSGGATGTGGSGPVTGAAGTTGSGGATGAAGAAGATGKGGTTGAAGATGKGGTTGAAGAAVTGTAGAGGVLFSDDFENGTASWNSNALGSATTVTDGSTAFELTCAMSSKTCLWANGKVSWTDVIVQARVKINSFTGSGSGYYAGICARVADASNFYCAALRSDGNVSIHGDIGGSNTSLGNSVSYGVVTGKWYTVQLEVVGSTITASIDGTPVLPKAGSSPIMDSSVTNGGVGLAVANTVAEFDDVVVTTP